MTWWAWSLVANAAITGIEWANRRAGTDGTWLEVLPATLPLIALAQYALYRSFGGAPTWFLAWAVFAVGSQALRVAAVAVAAPGEVTSWPTVGAGITVVLLGGLLVRRGLAG